MAFVIFKLISKGLKPIYRQIRENTRAISSIFLPSTLEFEGVKINAVGSHISPKIEQAIRSGYYEQAELQILKSCLSQSDTVMEIGAGIGFLSSYCAKQIGSEQVFAYEANPALEESIRHTYEINCVNPNLEICLIGAQTGLDIFYIASDFWESSFVKPIADKEVDTITVAAKSFSQEVRRINPSLLIVDIEGGEYELFKDVNLYNIQKIIIELHNSLIGDEKVQFVKTRLSDYGFKVVEKISNCDDEILFLQRLN